MWFPNNTRILLFSLAAFGAVFFPWWVTLLLAITLVARYQAWEIVPIGMYIDLVSLPSESMLSVPYATLLALLLVVLFEPFRRHLLIT